MKININYKRILVFAILSASIIFVSASTLTTEDSVECVEHIINEYVDEGHIIEYIRERYNFDFDIYKTVSDDGSIVSIRIIRNLDDDQYELQKGGCTNILGHKFEITYWSGPLTFPQTPLASGYCCFRVYYSTYTCTRTFCNRVDVFPERIDYYNHIWNLIANNMYRCSQCGVYTAR